MPEHRICACEQRGIKICFPDFVPIAFHRPYRYLHVCGERQPSWDLLPAGGVGRGQPSGSIFRDGTCWVAQHNQLQIILAQEAIATATIAAQTDPLCRARTLGTTAASMEYGDHGYDIRPNAAMRIRQICAPMHEQRSRRIVPAVTWK